MLRHFICFRFCLTVMAAESKANDDDDNIPCIQLVLFGTDAERVVGCAIDALPPGPETDWVILPEKINDVKRKTIEARVSVSSRSFDDGIIRFQVNRLLGVVAVDDDIPRQDRHPGTNIFTYMLPIFYENCTLFL
jgi:hypothetical protein